MTSKQEELIKKVQLLKKINVKLELLETERKEVMAARTEICAELAETLGLSAYSARYNARAIEVKALQTIGELYMSRET